MLAGDYLEQCASAVETIDTAELANKTLGLEIGKGSEATVYAIGSLTIAGSPVATCLKRDAHNLSRFRSELKLATLICRRVPALRPVFPLFMGVVTIRGREMPAAIITEDVSQGNRVSVLPQPVSPELRDQLYAGFSEAEARLIIRRGLDKYVAFDVAGTERWLDLSPPPINIYRPGTSLNEEARAIGTEAYSSIARLTCLIDKNTPLGVSLTSHERTGNYTSRA